MANGSAEDRVAILEAQVEELLAVVHVLSRTVNDHKVWLATGQPHHWCPRCGRSVPTFHTVWIDHPDKSGVGKCENSLKHWS